MKTKKIGIGFGLLMAVLLIVNLAKSQSVPQLINYQGRLTNTAGQPVNTTVPMHFALLDGDTMSATVLWGETQASVAVSQGIYNVMLGTVNPVPPSALSSGTVFLEVQVNGETLRPRQRVTSVAYAIRAEDSSQLGGLASNQFYSKTEVDNLLFTMQAQINDLQSQVAANTAGLAAETSDRESADSLLTGNLADEVNRALTAEAFLQTELDTEILDREAADTALSNRITPLETKLQPVNVTLSGSTVTDFFFTGTNVHIRSGSGLTDAAVNGKGNLIIGYNELRGSGDFRTGSHNLIVGKQQNFSSYGGMAIGLTNSISAPYAVVSGGFNNKASGWMASVSGGENNTASGYASSVSAGSHNLASGTWSSVAGGGATTAANGNKAYSDFSAILGGVSNSTGDGVDHVNGQYATVSGGSFNRASGPWSSVSGGSSNNASYSNSSVSGGRLNTASGPNSSVSGGENNTASNYASSVSGGKYNTASGNSASSVSGGKNNTASGVESSVSGGSYNVASGDYSSVTGGGGFSASDGNEAFAHYSAILGGYWNLTGDPAKIDRSKGELSSVSGGWRNNASNYFSSVCGGYSNIASGDSSSVSGGGGNTASGTKSSVSGGANRTVSGEFDWAACDTEYFCEQ